MSKLPEFKSSYPVIIMPYQKDWPAEYQRIAAQLQQDLGDLALRIDHIGSTSVPGLAAKDIIDIQVTVSDLQNPSLRPCLEKKGYTLHPHLRDVFLGLPEDSPELDKLVIGLPPDLRRANIHIRQQGRFNQRFALVFRDYLRHHDTVRDAYALIKERLAQIFPDTIEGYLYIKDPLMDMMYEAANLWAESTGWQPS